VEAKAKQVLMDLEKTRPNEVVTFSTCSLTYGDNAVDKKCTVTVDSKQQEVTNNISKVKKV
jgi:hypothetical protein